VPSDLARLEGEEYKKFASGYYEKVLGEDVIVEFSGDSIEELSQRASEIAEARKPIPIILTTAQADEPPLKHSFLINRSYVRDDGVRLFELVVYGPKDPKAWKEKMDKIAREHQPKPASPTEQQEFMQKAVKRTMGEMERTIMSAISKPPEGLGFASMDEFRTFFEENKKKFATDRKFNEFYRAEIKSRTEKARAIRREELVRKPPHNASQMPSILTDMMTSSLGLSEGTGGCLQTP
jgi:hypothetical protein